MPKKISVKSVGKQIAKKLFHPVHLFRFLRLLGKTNRSSRARDDAQLKLYSQVLSSPFLHYGHFDDPAVAPEEISLRDLQKAQLRYAELLLDDIVDKDSPILDVGSGLGGLISLLLQRKLMPVALTPDASQIQHIMKTYPNVPLIEEKFETMPVDDFRHYFGTVIMAESLQYLKLDAALSDVEAILKPDGCWIISDYFRVEEGHGKSGHQWEVFRQKLRERGWEITNQRDITENVLPTLACAYMWGKKLGPPLLTFALKKLHTKRPAFHYLVRETVEDLEVYLTDQLDIVNPQSFARGKKYVQLVVKRSE